MGTEKEERFLEQSLETAQVRVEDLDMVKGLEAYAGLVLREVAQRYAEYEELTDEQVEALDEAGKEQETIDDLHFFLRKMFHYARGARQCMEQRVFE